MKNKEKISTIINTMLRNQILRSQNQSISKEQRLMGWSSATAIVDTLFWADMISIKNYHLLSEIVFNACMNKTYIHK